VTTAIVYPTDRLSLPVIPGYAIEPQDPIARTDMEAGPARHRRRWTTTPTVFQATFVFTRYELAIFEGWFVHVADEGAAWFNIPLLSGLGVVLHEARFRSPYRAVPNNGGGTVNSELFTVTVAMEIRLRPILDAGATAIVLDSDIDALYATIDSFTHLVEHEFPT
jgi:hypothetical protein